MFVLSRDYEVFSEILYIYIYHNTHVSWALQMESEAHAQEFSTKSKKLVLNVYQCLEVLVCLKYTNISKHEGPEQIMVLFIWHWTIFASVRTEQTMNTVLGDEMQTDC